jgi:secondary thiamine-phosphate synthase enzyme
MEKISVKTKKRNEFVDITSLVKKLIEELGVENGICVLFCPHTTAGLTINEAFDPAVRTDMVYSFNKISPDYDEFRHAEGNSDAHIKASIVGPSLNLIINNGKILLGQWQGIYFAEFDGPRSREIWIETIKKDKDIL